MLQRFGLLFLLIFSMNVSAQVQPVQNLKAKRATKAKPTLGKRATKIVYGSNEWNNSTTGIDNAFLYVRDKKTGKIAKIILDESAPDSSTFEGQFSLDWGDKSQPEVFIPPQDVRGAKGIEKFKSMLRQGKIKRKPLVIRVNDDGTHTMDVYDTKDQAHRALKIYREELDLKKKNNRAKNLLENMNTDDATMEVAQMAEEERKKREAELASKKLEAERLRLEQLERQKTLDRLAKIKNMRESERQQRADEAKKLGEEGMKKFMANDFAGASELFQKALDLDPNNKDFSLNYAIALYRLEKYNESLAVLRTVPVDKRQNEKDFYTGLAHFNLKEYKPAIKSLEPVKASKDPDLAPSAAFYIGLSEMALKNWEPAKANFENVLDTSKSPELDRQAEKYIETIASIQQWEKKREKPFTLTAMVGSMYDSNVLLTPDGVDSSTATEEGDIRAILMGMLSYRAIYEKNHEFVPSFMSYYMYSSKSAVSSADPFLNNISLPYTYKGKAFNKGYKMTAKPAYEIINMDTDSSGSREVILVSPILNVDNTFVMSGKWISSYIFDLRLDDNQLASSVNDDDADAKKYTLTWKNLNFVDDKKKKILLTKIGYVLNDAVGKNKNYNRIEGSATFMKPIHWWKSTWSFGISMYKVEYPDLTSIRKDVNTTLTTGITRPVYDWLSFGLSATYTNNNSSLTANTYKRTAVTANFISNYSF